ncbi:MAG: TrkH family potassium uptake protein [candidate division WOR-3 bacterium]|jgi:trk system potassium uptake protein TrkH
MLLKRFRIIKTTRMPPGWLKPLFRINTTLAFFCLIFVMLTEGYRLQLPHLVQLAVRALLNLAGITTFAEIISKQIVTPQFNLSRLRRIFELLIAALLIPTLILQRFVLLLVFIYQAVNLPRFSPSGFFGNIRQRPMRMLALSFAVLIALGTLLLTFPAATNDGRGANLLTALFTATSATCVTGLIVKDTPTYFAPFGQIVILMLIQLGGLGIMTFYASLVVLLGQRLALNERRTIQQIIEETREIDIARMVRYVFLFTILAECIGTVILFLRWLFVLPGPRQALYFAVFHSISAFCNAGFSLFSDSLIRFQSDLVTNLCIISLIVVGGLGFPVVNELFNRQTLFRLTWLIRRREHSPAPRLSNLTIHSRLVLITTTLLIAAGTVLFFFLEYDNTLSSLPLGTKLLASLFQSVTARTAGFNTVSTTNLHPVTIFLWVILMFIGASPGGTGGGVKTSTLAVLLLAIRARVRGEEEIVYARRSIPKDVVYRATAIIALALGMLAICFAILLYSQSQRFEALLFEVASAFGTVGLSTGITPNLNIIGKLVIIGLMFVGRIGPLTLTLAMTAPRERSAIIYPQARIIVG